MSRTLTTAFTAGAFLAAVSCAHPKGLAFQDDPGRAGDGVSQHAGPYAAPPEAADHINGAPAGTLTAPATFDSRVYRLKFRYRVYVPAQYKPGHRAALMVFQDASRIYLGIMNAPTVLDNLIHAGEMPVTIALFLDPGTATGEYAEGADSAARSLQYDDISEKYSHFLLDEIIKDVVQKHYTIVTDPNGWALAGHGSGGVAAFAAAWRRPERFRKVLTQSASFVGNERGGALAPLVHDELVQPIRVYLSSSTNDLQNASGNWMNGNQAMANALAERGYEFRFRVGLGTHFPPLQAQADFPDALRWLWRGFTIIPPSH